MQIPVGFAQAMWTFTGSDLPRGAVTTLGLQLTGSVGGDERVVDLYDAFANTLLPNLSSNVTLQSCILKYGPQSVGPTYEFSGSVTGGKTGGMAPPNVAYLLEKRAFLGGRQNRGRMYLPGVPLGDITGGGDIGSGALSAIVSDCIDFEAALATAECEPVILHNGSSDPTTVTSIRPDPKVATQRRRLR